MAFVTHAGKITSEILLGIGCGFTLNWLSNIIAKKLNLDIYVKLIIQIMMIVVVIYVLNYLGLTALEKNIYFHTTFISSQPNITKFVSKAIFDEEH